MRPVVGPRPARKELQRAACLALWWTAGLSALWGCGSGQTPPGGRERILCAVSVLPQAYFVERIGGEHVEVMVLAAAGKSPATYEPTAKQVARLAESRLYFAIGMPFEVRVLPLVRGRFPAVEVVEMRAAADAGRTAGAVSPAEPGAADPHVWLNPRLAKALARGVRDALVGADPRHAREYGENCDALVDDLDRADREIADMLAPFRGSDLFVFHPAYGHFAEAYGLNQVAIETGGITPGSKHLAEVIRRARARGARAIFIQPQFSSTTARTVAEAAGAEPVTLDPLARDYLANLRTMAQEIRTAFAGE